MRVGSYFSMPRVWGRVHEHLPEQIRTTYSSLLFILVPVYKKRDFFK